MPEAAKGGNLRPLFEMRLVLLAAALVCLTLTGCKGSCRSLSERLCDCSANSVTKDACLQVASRAEASYPPTAEDEARCAELLKGCDCRLIDTPEGKKACGLSR